MQNDVHSCNCQLEHPYGFPFPPYSVQKDLMDRVFSLLDVSKRRSLEQTSDGNGGTIGIFESPTGSGKSLSLICSVLHWYKDHLPAIQENHLSQNVPESAEGDPDWVSTFVQAKKLESFQASKERKQRERNRMSFFSQKMKNLIGEENADLFKYISADSESDEDESIEEHRTQIIYCSRTHSQIAQFVSEIKKTQYSSDIHCMTLGSRKNLCVNPQVSSIEDSFRMNEKCLDLISSKKSPSTPAKRPRAPVQSSACAFFGSSPSESHQKCKTFSKITASSIHDIEELHQLGKDTKSCPYYASRIASASADLVALPYTSLVHEETRKSIGIDLKNSILIIDEAHNLVESINGVYGVEIVLEDLQSVFRAMLSYFEARKNVLKAENVVYLKRIFYILTKVVKYLEEGEGSSFLTVSVNDFLIQLKIDNQNCFDLITFINDFKLIQKMRSFVSQTEDFEFSKLKDLLSAFTNANADGKVFVRFDGSLSKFKFVNLNASQKFLDIVYQCQVVLMVGGTMRPFEFYEEQLLHSAKLAPLVSKFSCSHVIDPENVLPMVLSSGPSRVPFKFTFDRRKVAAQNTELMRTLINYSRIIPGGIIVFLQSFAFMDALISFWKSTGIWEKLSAIKKVFIEPRSAIQLECVMSEYASCVQSEGGGILFCVVNGKMSEGINFSDDLARCVFMVGLPFPNLKDPETMERMAFIRSDTSKEAFGLTICMRAVNQSIGRAIRHKNDYASIILLDVRFADETVMGYIPDWIRSRIQVHPSFGTAFQQTVQFFKGKRVH